MGYAAGAIGAAQSDGQHDPFKDFDSCVFASLIAFGGQRVLARRAEASAQHRLKMAASMVSSVGGFEISRRLSLLEVEAAQSSLLDAMLLVDQTPNDRGLWIAPQNWIYQLRDEMESAGVQVDSVFLNDAQGVQIARAPLDASVGKNFAYRQYFHGGLEDLDPEDAHVRIHPPAPSRQAIVSNAYVSTNRSKESGYPIKTALSVPIVVRAQENERVVGRLGVSLKINELAIFDSLVDLPMEAILVETRDYPWGRGRAAGLILDRFTTRSEVGLAGHDSSGREVPIQELQDTMPRLQPQSLQQLGEYSSLNTQLFSDFFDPQVNRQRGEVASADLKIPYRSGNSNRLESSVH